MHLNSDLPGQLCRFLHADQLYWLVLYKLQRNYFFCRLVLNVYATNWTMGIHIHRQGILYVKRSLFQRHRSVIRVFSSLHNMWGVTYTRSWESRESALVQVILDNGAYHEILKSDLKRA